MVSIDKLGIQGIRSFGPDKMERIEFEKPVTLIVGKNGCGDRRVGCHCAVDRLDCWLGGVVDALRLPRSKA